MRAKQRTGPPRLAGAVLVAATFLALAASPGAAGPQPTAVETLLHSTLFGGNSYDYIGPMDADGAGNIYLAGYTYSTDLTSGVSNPYDGTLNGTTDAFVAKLDPTGSTLQWATYLGGDSYELTYAVAAAANGTVFVGGRSYGAGFPTTPSASDRTYTGYYGDGFVTAFSPTGSLVWSTYLGGGLLDQVNAIAVGPRGVVYAAGYTTSLDFPATNQVWDGSANGGEDAFIAALSPADGSLIYATYLGGSANDSVSSIAVDSAGRVVVVGETLSDDFPTTNGAYQTSPGGAADVFVTRINETGAALMASTYVGGSADETAGGVAIDASGRPTISGSTLSPNFETTAGAYDRVRDGEDAFALQLAADGSSIVFSTFLGGGGSDAAVDLALSDGGDILLLGQTTSNTDFPTTNDAKFGSYLGGVRDLFVTRMDATGSRLQYSTYFGGSSTDTPKSIVAQGVDRALVSGYTASATFPTHAGAHDRSISGVYDTFASELKTAYRVTYATSPGGLQVSLDGSSRATPFVVACPFDESIALVAPAVQQQDDTRYVFADWTGSLPQSHVLRCTADGAYTAFYDTEYRWTVAASRPNVTVRVDNATVEAPYSWWCPADGGAYVDVQVNQTGNGSRFTFTGWSDGGARAHALPCAGPGTLTANFATEFSASVVTDPPGLSMTTTPAYADAPVSFWCPAGQPIVLSATAFQELLGTRYAFAGWADGPAALPRSVTCDGPIDLTARFSPVEHRVTLQTDPAGLDLQVGSTGVSSPYSAWCSEGSTVNVTAPALQERAGVRYGFVQWVGLGDPVPDPFVAAPCDGPLGLTASFGPAQFRVRMLSDPPGLELQHGPETDTAPVDVWCQADLSLLVNAPSPQVAEGVRHTFHHWSTNRTQAHAAPCDGTSNLTATFTVEVLVNLTTDPPGLNVTVGGRATRTPGGEWCRIGGTLNLSAPEFQEGERSRFAFDAWADGGPRDRTLSCAAPAALVARYVAEYEVRITTNPPGLEVSVDGEVHVAPITVYWDAGSTHEVELPTPQTVGAQVYTFTVWSDGGGRRHTVTPTAPMDLMASAVTGGVGDFALEPEVPQVQVGPGSSAVLVVGLREVNTYAGPPVEITVVDPPEGITARCVPAPIDPGDQCALEVKVAAGVAPGEYPLTLRASNGTTSRTLQVVLNVPSGGPIEATSPAGWLLPLAAVLLVAAAGGLGFISYWRWRRSQSAGQPPKPAHGRDEKQ